MRLATPALVLGCLVPPAAVAQDAVVTVSVVNVAGGPIQGARVSLVNSAAEWITDSLGVARVRSPRLGEVMLSIRRLGFEPATAVVVVQGGDITHARVVMQSAVQALPEVSVLDSVVARSPMLAGFERRRMARVGSSTFITRADITKQAPTVTSDLLRRVTAIKMIDSAGVLLAVSRRSEKAVIVHGKGDDLAPCALRVAVDGYLREEGFAVNSLSPAEIHGIEIYPGPATIPAEYASMRRDAACGLIAIWTRR